MSTINVKEDPQLSKVGKIEKADPDSPKRKSPNQHRYSEVRSREHLLPEEVDAMMKAIRKHNGRHSHRDSTLILLLYRHGLRVSEVAALRWEQVDFAGERSMSTASKMVPQQHILSMATSYGRSVSCGETIPIARSSLCLHVAPRLPLTPSGASGEQAGKLAELPFPVHAHMLRHACGYYLAREKTDTRTIQGYLGHKNIQHTVRYTQLSPEPYKGLWKKA